MDGRDEVGLGGDVEMGAWDGCGCGLLEGRCHVYKTRIRHPVGSGSCRSDMQGGVKLRKLQDRWMVGSSR